MMTRRDRDEPGLFETGPIGTPNLLQLVEVCSISDETLYCDLAFRTKRPFPVWFDRRGGFAAAGEGAVRCRQRPRRRAAAARGERFGLTLSSVARYSALTRNSARRSAVGQRTWVAQPKRSNTQMASAERSIWPRVRPDGRAPVPHGGCCATSPRGTRARAERDCRCDLRSHRADGRTCGRANSPPRSCGAPARHGPRRPTTAPAAHRRSTG